MPGTRLNIDAQGRLVVPNDPIVPVVEGDGAGPVLWRSARAALDAAVAGAYGGRRRLHFLELPAGERGLRESRTRAPDATVNAFRTYRVGLVGAQRPAREGPTLHGELREILDLYATTIRIHAPAQGLDLLLVREERELGASAAELAPGTAAAHLALAALAKAVPAALAEQRFGTAAQADRAREAHGDLATGILETAVALRDVSAFGTKRLVATALELAGAAGFRELRFLHDVERLPRTEGARRAWAEAVARETKAALEPVPVSRFLGRVLGEARGAWLGGADAIDAAIDVLWARLEDPAFASTAAVNGETGHAVFGPLADPRALANEPGQAHPFGLVRAGEALLRHLRWNEAADAVAAAVADVRKAGHLGEKAGEALVGILRT